MAQTAMWFFIFILISLSGNPTSACEIKFEPPKVVVKFGDPLFANCISTSCTNVEGMGWETTFEGLGGLKKNVAFLPLNVTNVTAWNPKPQCYITFSDNQDQKLKTLPITVYKMPTRVSFNQSHWGPMVEGQLYSLQCDAVDFSPTNSLSVVWYKGNKIYSEAKNLSLSLNKAISVIQVKPNRDDDGSEISCEAKLNLWPEGQGPSAARSESRKLTVKYRPTFVEPDNETLEITPETKITLNCKAAGNPSPSYSWRFAHSTQEEMQNRNEMESILILEHSGTYSCTASNELGQTTKYFIVIEAKGDRTAFAVVLGGFICLGAVLFTAGLVFVTPNGTFAFPKGSSGVI